MTDLSGGCLCGAVRYLIKGRPKLSVACHCRDCQYVSGGGPAYAMILAAEDVIITKGAAKEHWVTSAKGNRVARLFCETCGTPLFAKSEKHPEFLPVKPGSLDDPSRFAVQANTWVGSAQQWHCINAALPEFSRDPEMGPTALFELVRASAVKLARATGLVEHDRNPGRVMRR